MTSDSDGGIELDSGRISTFVDEVWEHEIIPELESYIAIPAKSPAFDPDWQTHGYIDEAVAHIEKWCRGRGIDGLEIEVVRLEGRTPLVYIEHPGTSPFNDGHTVLLYGHLDKAAGDDGLARRSRPLDSPLRSHKLYGAPYLCSLVRSR